MVETTSINALKEADFKLKLNWNLNSPIMEQAIEKVECILESKQISKIDLIVAISTVISQISGAKNPVLGIKLSSDTENFQLLSLPVQENSTLSKARDYIDDLLSLPPIYHDADTTKELKESGSYSDISLGIAFVNEESLEQYEPPYPLTCAISENADGTVIINCYYNCSLYTNKSVTMFLNSINNFTQQLNEVNQNLLCLPLLSESQMNRIIDTGYAKELKSSRNIRIEEHFSKLAQMHPSKTALVCSDKTITYKELDQLSSTMAASLALLGAEPGDAIGLCLDRSYHLIASILAILKVGGAYVPMDPAYPSDRLTYTCQNSGIKLVITNLETFPNIESTQLVTPDYLENHKEKKEINDTKKNNLSSSNTAYIIYTSGSTGRPKGVEVTHDNLLSLIKSAKGYFDLQRDDVWTFYHSAAFDYSVWEIWGCLLTGGKLVIVPYWISRSPGKYYDLVKKHKVTILNQTPSSFTQFMNIEKENPVNNFLRLILLGGEELDTAILKQWQTRYPVDDFRVENMYGITETTVIATSKRINESDILHGTRSIGKPLPGWYIYILDDNLNILPYGVPGEIYIGGVGIAKGYINQPDLTSNRYIPDPFREGIMYKSGDRGLLLENGEIEFLGRLDTQVKLRGCRIELDEIRNVILTIDEVQSAHVVLNQTDKNDSATARLDSYIVLNSEISMDKLIETASNKLPSYMMPSTFTVIDKIPMTHNGKIDIKALPEPIIKSDCINTDIDLSNADDLISKMITIWQEVLGCSVKPEDNFFSLGGNSLYAVRIAYAMSEAGLPELPLRELYVHQTIEKLLPFIKQAQN